MGVIAADDLRVDMTGQRLVAAGAMTQWTATATNLGPSNEPGPVKMVLTFPSDVTPTRGTGTGWTCAVAGRTVTCTGGAVGGKAAFGLGVQATIPLPAGAVSTPITITGRVAVSATDITVTSVVSGTIKDVVPDNNKAQFTSVAVANADLSVAKTADNPTPTSHGAVTFRITVTNHGPGTSTGAVVTDPLPAGLVANLTVSDPRCSFESGALRCSPGDLDAGQSTTFVLVTAPAPTLTGVTNVATVTATSDHNAANNRGQATVVWQSPLATTTTTTTTTPSPTATTPPVTLPPTGAFLRAPLAFAAWAGVVGGVLVVLTRRRSRSPSD
jgi:uncharacterized repeat protein (TIGR01451 family)